MMTSAKMSTISFLVQVNAVLLINQSIKCPGPIRSLPTLPKPPPAKRPPMYSDKMHNSPMYSDKMHTDRQKTGSQTIRFEHRPW